VAIGVGEDDRAGRWKGHAKTECGLHTQMFKDQDLSKLKSNFETDISVMERRKKDR